MNKSKESLFIRINSIIDNHKFKHAIWHGRENNNRYYTDFCELAYDFYVKLSESEFNNFLKKSRLDKNIDLSQYLQFASEVTIVDYIIRNFSNSFKNEPKYNKKKNPECSFSYNGRIINMEIKCPDYKDRKMKENTDGIKIIANDRLPNKETYDKIKKTISNSFPEDNALISYERMDNKLKDFLLSANEKFPESKDKYFNILVIALETIPDMDEWYSYLFAKEGAFTHESFIKNDYSHVDAVMLTNVAYGHQCDKVDLNRNLWHFENYCSLIFMDPRKECDFELTDYCAKYVLELFGGHTRNFLAYLKQLDIDNEKRDNIINNTIPKEKLNLIKRELYINDRIFNSRIIQNWLEHLKEKEN